MLRIEDLDTPRNKEGAERQAIEDLLWLGIDWDEGPYVQSHDLGAQRQAMRRLARAGLAFPSDLTRSQIEAVASAPQEGAASHEIRFPPELRPPLGPRDFDDERTNWRFACPSGPVGFADEFAGEQRHEPGAVVGDFVIWTQRGCPSYQLAVVVDDHRQGITHIVRGNDLLESAARQILLARALGFEPLPSYCHLPLVRGEDGRRLAKRHGDTRIARYRDAGVPFEHVVGLIAFWCGIVDRRARMTPAEFRECFELGMMPKDDITFCAEDDAWLLSRS